MKKLALTFDDGPDPRYTGKLLDVLKSNDVKATFFVLAANAAENPELIMRMKSEGHCIALHSLEHRHAFLCKYLYTGYDFRKIWRLWKVWDAGLNFTARHGESANVVHRTSLKNIT